MTEINFPIGSEIGGNFILHQGNHDGRGNPHDQYISKWSTHRTKVWDESNPNSITKIAEINYEQDTNTALGYQIEVVNEFATDKVGYINLTLGKGGVLNFTVNNSTYFYASYTIENTTITAGKQSSKVSIYVKLVRNFRSIFYRLSLAKNSQPQSFSNYPENYAYQAIKLLSDQPLLPSVAGSVSATNIPTVGTTPITTVGDGTLSGAVGLLDTKVFTQTGIKFTFEKVGRIVVLKIEGSPTQQIPVSAWFTILSQANIPTGFTPASNFSIVGMTVANGERFSLGYSGNGITVFPRTGLINTNDSINLSISYIV